MSDPRIVVDHHGRPTAATPDGTTPDGVQPAGPTQDAAFDPLRLCIFATVALLGWLLGPVALVAFAALGLLGYIKARRAGLTRSKCLLRDTRLVIGYLAILVIAGVAGAAYAVGGGRVGLG